MYKGWAILPAAQAIFNKTKVTIAEIASFWKEGTVVIMEKPNGHYHFIAGASGGYSNIGAWRDCYHDQTGAQMGRWKVLEEVRYKIVDGTLETTTASGNPAPLQLKAALAVFK